MIHRRSMAPDLSKNSWADPRAYYLIMKYALTNLPFEFTFTSALITDSIPKFKKHAGQTYIVGFGNYTDGDFVTKDVCDTDHNIRHRPMIFDTSVDHYFKEFKGTRWVMAFYTLAPTKIPMIRSLSDYEAVVQDGKWVIAWYRTGEPAVYLSKKNGLPQPTNKKKVKEIRHEVIDNPRFTRAQNLLHRALEKEVK